MRNISKWLKIKTYYSKNSYDKIFSDFFSKTRQAKDKGYIFKMPKEEKTKTKNTVIQDFFFQPK